MFGERGEEPRIVADIAQVEHAVGLVLLRIAQHACQSGAVVMQIRKNCELHRALFVEHSGLMRYT